MSLSPSPFSSAELHLSEAAYDELLYVREMLSRLQYAPSRKTILNAFLAVLPDWCVENIEKLPDIRSHTIWKRRIAFKLDSKVHDLVRGDLFATPMKEVDLSQLLDYLLVHQRESGHGRDLQGRLLASMARSQYLKKKGILMFRLPEALEQGVHPMSKQLVGQTLEADTWKRRCSGSSKEYQESIQSRIEELFLHRKFSPKVWPPLREEHASCREEAARLLRNPSTLRLISIQLREEAFGKVRKMDPTDLETAAVATLVWCKNNNLLQCG
ncbi:hypothetical protein OJ996_07480 [Luteolibacter sp. GHJ8]|uniref:Uncharacterized protein n=1 Tax=Luteolibacter rhizosphaerae TaxID=2989719 RepID=A0ABT3G0Q2_9BACT|nr:hypothetical protein [Luteolibacter rhizosphaerae]MCW1913408.1 hypothetical protein [Luteolibacter rhizosphaerae]